MIRAATLDDLDALEALEEGSFSGDRLSRRSWRHYLSHSSARCLVRVKRERVVGYALVTFYKGTSLARLYSLAVAEDQRGKGIGRELLIAAEQAALEAGAAFLRLEVSELNQGAIGLYSKNGYQRFGLLSKYYEDQSNAIRMEKPLRNQTGDSRRKLAYFAQTLPFTCGPAALLMAMRGLDPQTEIGRRAELRIWREATTIFMTAGHGGCSPYGLALAAHRRGFEVEVYASAEEELFLDSVRDPDRKEVIRIVEKDFISRLRELSVPLRRRALRPNELHEAVARGYMCLVLISTYRLDAKKVPHWVVVTGGDEKFIYVHDPWVDSAAGRGRMESMHVPIPISEFTSMARYGKRGQRAVLILKQRHQSVTEAIDNLLRAVGRRGD